MAKTNKTIPKGHESPALLEENREAQLTSLAMNLAEQRLREGKATSQEIVYFLKAGSPDEKLRRQLLEAQSELARARADAIRAEKDNAELFAEAMRAFKEYSGEEEEYSDDETSSEY